MLTLLKAWETLTVVEPYPSYPSAVRVAKLYRKRIAPTGKVYIRKLGYDSYRLDAIPPDVRRKYEEKRRRAIKPLLEDLERTWRDNA